MGFSPRRVMAAAVALSLPALAADESVVVPADRYCVPAGAASMPARARPGVPVDRYELPPCEPDAGDEDRLRPWVNPMELGPPVPDRWRIVEHVGVTTDYLNPYKGQNPIKGDRPLWGEDWFYSIIGISDTVIEPRRFPLPVGVATTARPGSFDTIGHGASTVLAQSFIVENVIYKGDTVFKPPDWEFRFTPVFNINQVHVDEKGVLNVDPDLGGSSGRKRRDTFTGIQALFVDKHLRNVSDRYDFDSVRVGISRFRRTSAGSCSRTSSSACGSLVRGATTSSSTISPGSGGWRRIPTVA